MELKHLVLLLDTTQNMHYTLDSNFLVSPMWRRTESIYRMFVMNSIKLEAHLKIRFTPTLTRAITVTVR